MTVLCEKIVSLNVFPNSAAHETWLTEVELVFQEEKIFLTKFANNVVFQKTSLLPERMFCEWYNLETFLRTMFSDFGRP